MNGYISVDLGGTHLRAAIADTDTGQICRQRKCPTLAAEGQEAVIQWIFHLIRELTQESEESACDINGVGIDVPGIPDRESSLAAE